MSGYEVLPIDPSEYRDTITGLWREYLPGTPESRFEWLNLQNPAGRTLWFAAFERRTCGFAGMLSVMPKVFFLREREIKAGVMGDFVVTKAHRVFGPAHILPKAALSACQQMGMTVLYTVPNHDSERIVERAGFDTRTTLGCYVKPLSSAHYLRRGVVRRVGAPVGYVLDLALRIASRDSYAISGGRLSEVASVDEAFDILWKGVKGTSEEPVSDHSSAYLRWRYLSNPHYRFRVLTLSEDSRLIGYAIFTSQDDRMEVYDVMPVQPSLVYRLLGGLAEIARREKCRVISIAVVRSHPLVRPLNRCLFLDSGDNLPVLMSSTEPALCEHLQFSNAERNI